jgi:hypothetical protein
MCKYGNVKINPPFDIYLAWKEKDNFVADKLLTTILFTNSIRGQAIPLLL